MLFNVRAAALLTCGIASVAARAATGLTTRSTTDVCGDVDDTLVVPGLFGIKTSFGRIDKCICQSQITTLLKTDPQIITAVAFAGEATVKNALTDMLNASKDHQKCVYPDNADPLCASGAPCGFKCKNGFTPSPDKKPVDCVCKAPNKVCNGVCGKFKACPSGKPFRRDTLRKRALCGEGLTACGIFGHSSVSRDAWECINTATDLESCGGCAFPLDAFSPHGVDCTAIPGVTDVSCMAGSCVVHRCAPGFIVSEDSTFCVAAQAMLEQNAGTRVA
ncbi:hypothetical protein L227DRAFT_276386 [Lentinus tigrinus ALCF2SS1-6]|uniref:Protein CPL1-like domain-containing protein n=1 Tax=Lentinus tigrinus ALCF2SS1-6 TaxID=1328759 RepID=A0A5C2SUS4_9APHY|nr:hypothetical protein L227DRAFT_276386 [Lentinus tigrinus ALCF2SS1-6]